MPKTDKYFHKKHSGSDYFVRISRDSWIMLDAYARITDTTKMNAIMRECLADGFKAVASRGFEKD